MTIYNVMRRSDRFMEGGAYISIGCGVPFVVVGRRCLHADGRQDKMAPHCPPRHVLSPQNCYKEYQPGRSLSLIDLNETATSWTAFLCIAQEHVTIKG